MELLKNYIKFYFFSFLFAVNPLTYNIFLDYQYNNDSELYRVDDVSLNYLKLGSQFDLSIDNLLIKGEFSYNLYAFSNYIPYNYNSASWIKPDQFNSMNGFGKIENSPGLDSSQFNYFESLLSIHYKINNFSIYSKLESPGWGLGVSKIVISDKVPPFFNLGYTWDVTNKIKYEHMYGKLVSLIDNHSLDSLYNLDYRTAEYNRNIMAHKLQYDFSNNFRLHLYELVVYGGYRTIEPYYLLPFIPFLPIQTYLGDIDNDLISIGFEYDSQKTGSIFFLLTVDEWSPPYTFEKENKNWFVYQLGGQKEDFLLKESLLRYEYVWSDYRVYQHRFSINNYYSYGYPLGFWGGAHSEYIFIDYTFPINKVKFTIGYENSKRGHLTDEMLDNQYNDNNYVERYSEGFENKSIYRFNLNFNISQKMNFNIGYNHINWTNPSFVIDTIDYDLIENLIIKDDYYISMRYDLKNNLINN